MVFSESPTQLIRPRGPLTMCLSKTLLQLVQPFRVGGHFAFFSGQTCYSLTIIGGRSKSITPSRCKRVFTKCLFRFTCPVSVQCPPAAPDNFSPHHVPCVNIPPPANLLPPTSQTIVENAKHTDKEKQGPIYQHRPDSSSFIGDKKRTAVHLSFAETGKTGIRAPLAAGS